MIADAPPDSVLGRLTAFVQGQQSTPKLVAEAEAWLHAAVAEAIGCPPEIVDVRCSMRTMPGRGNVFVVEQILVRG